MDEIAPLIKIAPSKEEQAKEKQFIKDVEGMADTLRPDGTVVSERHKDQFFGGPYHGFICSHQPNGPRAHNDPNGNWADYYIKDKLYIPDAHGKISGYHIYSTVRNIMGSDGYINKGHASQWGLGTRTTNYRKCYYYIGFFDEGFLALEGISVADFTGIFTQS